MLDRKTSDESQAQLLRRIAAQDRQALTEFYDQTAAVLFSTDDDVVDIAVTALISDLRMSPPTTA